MDPVLTFTAEGRDGRPARAQLFTGTAEVESDSGGILRTLRSSSTELTFSVPGADSYPSHPELVAWAEASLAWLEVSGGDIVQSGPYGVESVSVELADDGGGTVSPVVRVTVAGGEPMLLRYRLTVTRPSER